MAEYLILIYEDEARWRGVDPDIFNRIMAEHRAFGVKHRGALLGGHALASTTTATSVRTDSAGGFVVIDGAFAETKEALDGYYVINAADLDEALRIAWDVSAPFGGDEVRPVRVFD